MKVKFASRDIVHEAAPSDSASSAGQRRRDGQSSASNSAASYTLNTRNLPVRIHTMSVEERAPLNTPTSQQHRASLQRSTSFPGLSALSSLGFAAPSYYMVKASPFSSSTSSSAHNIAPVSDLVMDEAALNKSKAKKNRRLVRSSYSFSRPTPVSAPRSPHPISASAPPLQEKRIRRTPYGVMGPPEVFTEEVMASAKTQALPAASYYSRTTMFTPSGRIRKSEEKVDKHANDDAYELARHAYVPGPSLSNNQTLCTFSTLCFVIIFAVPLILFAGGLVTATPLRNGEEIVGRTKPFLLATMDPNMKPRIS